MRAVREINCGKNRIILKIKASGTDKVEEAIAVVLGPKYENVKKGGQDGDKLV